MRFSLKTLIVSVLVVSLLLSLYVVSHRLGVASSELAVLRSELGYLNVTDDTKINFISVPQHEEMKWRWRVRLPSNRKYDLCIQAIGIDDEGFRRAGCTTFFVDSGDEFTVTVVGYRNQLGEWNLKAMTTEGHSQHIGFLGPTSHAWLEGESTCTYRLNGQKGTVSSDATEPAELLRLRILDADGTKTNDGVLVWIEEARGRR